MNRTQQIEERYLGQSIQDFFANGGNAHDYAEQVFSGAIFGRDTDPTAPDLGIHTAADLAEALEAAR